MRFKAVLVGAMVQPPTFGKGKSDPIPWQAYGRTQHEVEEAGKQVLEGLTAEEQKVARVDVKEVTEVLLAEIHVAAVQPNKDGKLSFAVARHDGADTSVTTVKGLGA